MARIILDKKNEINKKLSNHISKWQTIYKSSNVLKAFAGTLYTFILIFLIVDSCITIYSMYENFIHNTIHNTNTYKKTKYRIEM